MMEVQTVGYCAQIYAFLFGGLLDGGASGRKTSYGRRIFGTH